MLDGGRFLINVEIIMKDEDGNIVENGDSTDYDQYKGLSRRLFSGKLMAIIGKHFRRRIY